MDPIKSAGPLFGIKLANLKEMRVSESDPSHGFLLAGALLQRERPGSPQPSPGMRYDLTPPGSFCGSEPDSPASASLLSLPSHFSVHSTDPVGENKAVCKGARRRLWASAGRAFQDKCRFQRPQSRGAVIPNLGLRCACAEPSCLLLCFSGATALRHGWWRPTKTFMLGVTPTRNNPESVTSEQSP